MRMALADLIMKAHLPVRLHLLVPAVENAFRRGALRPGDIVKSRAGLHVEIDNTDAEGRLILADAMTKAVEDKAELMVDFATLTGAARTLRWAQICQRCFANVDESGLGNDSMQARRWAIPFGGCHCGNPMPTCSTATLPIPPTAVAAFAGAITAALFHAEIRARQHSLGASGYLSPGAARQSRRGPKAARRLGLRAVYRYLSEALSGPLRAMRLSKGRDFGGQRSISKARNL
jgi:leucyl aminopeptidase